MKSLLQLFVLIICTPIAGCQSDDNPIVAPKIDLTISNDFNLLEMLTADFGVLVSDGKIYQGNEIKAISTFSFYHSNWIIDGALSNENIDSLSFIPISNHTIIHKGYAPKGYENYNLQIDTSIVTRKIILESYRQSGNNQDYSSPFNCEFSYSGNYSYVDSSGVTKDIRIIDSVYSGDYFLFVDLNNNCVPNFFITHYGKNGFYSDFHTDFLCDGFYDAKIYGIYSQGELEMKIILDGESTDGKRIQKQIKYNVKR